MPDSLSPGIEPSDDSLVEAALMGSAAAFEQLVLRYHGMVYVIGFAHLRSHESAEDLAQEVFLRVYLHLSEFGRRCSFSSWLSRIARNLAFDWLRRGQAASRLGTHLPIDTLSDRDMPKSTIQGAREKMEANDLDRVLHDAVFALPPDQREMVLLLTVEDLSQQEIASRLGVHRVTVSRQLQKATATLRGTVGPILANTARAWRPPKQAVARTLAAISATALLSVEAKSAMAAATGLGGLAAAPQTGPTAGGLVQSAGDWFAHGTAAKVGAKAATAIVAGACLLAGSYYFLAGETRQSYVGDETREPPAAAAVASRNEVQAKHQERPEGRAVREKIRDSILSKLPPATDGARLIVPKAPFGALGADISADGKTIAYNRNPEDGPWELWLYSLADGSQKEVAPWIKESKASPSFSPDGKHLVFTGFPKSGVWICEVESGTAKLLIGDPRIIVVDWSYDSKFLTYTVCPEDPEVHAYIVIYDLEQGKIAREIHDKDAVISESSLSPDGKSIVYKYEKPGNSETRLAIQSLVTGERKFPNSHRNAQSPTYSPDGKTIAYRWGYGEGMSEICLLDVASGKTKQLTYGYGVLPAWWGNSKGIVFTSYRDGGESQIYSIELPKAAEAAK